MNKKIGFLLLVILIAVGGGLFYFYKDKITTQQQPVVQVETQNQEGVQAPAFSVIDEKDFAGSAATESYKIGSVEFKIYSGSDVTVSPGYFEVYEGTKKVFASQPNYQVGGILAFNFGDNKYAVVKDYSGGAHCCDTDYLFRINKAGEVKFLKAFDMGNATITKDNLLFSGGKLYLVLTDDSFQYFHTAYVNSYFFQQYYRLDGDTVVAANSDFAATLTKAGDDCKAKIAKAPAQPDSDGNYWLNDVVCYIANYTLIGKQATALRDFDGFFNAFFPTGTGKDSFGETITRAALKQEIVDTLKNERFK